MEDHLKSIESAYAFYAPVYAPVSNTSLGLAETSAPLSFSADAQGSAFDPTGNPNGLASGINLGQEVPKELEPEAQKQNQYLLDLTGLCSAYVRGQANDNKNQDLLFDTKLWLDCYTNLPLTSEPTYTKQTFSQKVVGIEIAAKFLETILGFVVAPASSIVVSQFSGFISGLGDQIRAGISSGSKTFQTSSLTSKVILKDSRLVPSLEGYFINFTQSQSKIYSSCASAEAFQMTFEYMYAYSEFNYGALSNPDVKKQVDELISGSQIDDIKKSKGFFGAVVKKS
jgi:hypothetical protein